ncbi:magnesium-dependent phosphatase 1-like [Microplitis mediator]|uniref:magnesium-dependent phosphatase 1-like n=1 Tax=Microplitis mediator TaxID=375433 RepID=UPI002555ACA3|nr:magnesium-dependent phosphatase 1-like [Microplitis mediator]
MHPNIRRKPKLLVFDYDYILWPFSFDKDVAKFISRENDGSIVDNDGKELKCYEQVPEILENLTKEGFKIAIASEIKEVLQANELIRLLEWDKFITYRQPGLSIPLVRLFWFRNEKGIHFDDMIFFYAKPFDASEIISFCLGLTVILVENGLNNDLIENALEKFGYPDDDDDDDEDEDKDEDEPNR